MLRVATSRLLLLAALAAAPLQAQLVAQAIPAVPRVEGTSRARLRNLTTLLDDYVAQGKLASMVQAARMLRREHGVPDSPR